MAAIMCTLNHRVCSSSLVISNTKHNFEGNREQNRSISSYPLVTVVLSNCQFPAFSCSVSIRSSKRRNGFHVAACLPSSQETTTTFTPSTRLYVSGLSFRTTEENLRNAFQNFGQLIEVKLVMDKIANRSRGFAFLRYATKEESAKAIEGMNGKFLDGRVIFVEFAKPRPQVRQDVEQNSRR